MGRSLSFAAKQTQGGVREGTKERWGWGSGGNWAASQQVAILLLERIKGFGCLDKPTGLNTGLAGGRGVSLFVVSVFSDPTHSSSLARPGRGSLGVQIPVQFLLFLMSALPQCHLMLGLLVSLRPK